MEKRNSTILIQVRVQTARHCIERLLRPLVPGINGNRSYSDQYTDDLQHLYPLRKASLPPQPTPVLPFSTESSDFYSIVELMRSKWLAADENNRLDYLERFKQTCDKYLQSIRTQHLSTGHDTQFHQVLHSFLTSILDLLYYLTSSNLDLSIRIKLVLSTCLGWLIKHAQVIYCKRNYKTICTVFKNILLHGQSNNRQLAVSAVCFSSVRLPLLGIEARWFNDEYNSDERSFGFTSNWWAMLSRRPKPANCWLIILARMFVLIF